MTTFADVLAARLRRDPGRPLVTWYDEATGERVELSVTTYANWVAKLAGLLGEEHELERGMRLRIDLPPHWLGTTLLGAAWLEGLVVTDDPDPDLVVCGPATLARWAPRAGELPVLACALLPLAVRFAEPLPPGVHDVGADVWSQPDSRQVADPPGEDDLALDLGGERHTQGELWRSAAAGRLTGGGRLLTAVNPASPPGATAVAEPLAGNGSLVLVSGAGPDRLDAIARDERVTARFPASGHQSVG